MKQLPKIKDISKVTQEEKDEMMKMMMASTSDSDSEDAIEAE